MSKRTSEQMQETGRLGGKATLAKYGSEYYSAISKKRKKFGGGRPKKPIATQENADD